MMTIETLRTETMNQIGKASARDRAAYQIAESALTIEKEGRYYVLTLFNNSVRVHVNTKYPYKKINDLLCNNVLWTNAKQEAKARYCKEA